MKIHSGFIPPAFLVFLVIVLISIRPAETWSFYCGNKIVSEGNTKDEVRQKCGKPISVRRGEYYSINRVIPDAEIWTYRIGNSIYTLYFDFEDELVLIKTRLRGWNEKIP